MTATDRDDNDDDDDEDRDDDYDRRRVHGGGMYIEKSFKYKKGRTLALHSLSLHLISFISSLRVFRTVLVQNPKHPYIICY